MAESPFTRRDFLKTAGLTAAALGMPGLLNCGRKKRRPNILFIMTDDHASHALSCYGSQLMQTPNLDRIAQEGMRFDNCFCTNSICAPSRATILTGKYSHLNGVPTNRSEFDGTQPTFPKILQQAGYQTAMIGKWHLKSDPVGFDYWNVLPGQGQYYNPDFTEIGTKKRYEGYCTDLITDLALDWLGERDTEKPFCMLYWHKAPHRNWMPAPRHLHLFDDREMPYPPTWDDDYITRSDAARQQEMTIDHDLFDDFDLKLDPDRTASNKLKKNWRNMLARLNPSQRAAWDAAYDPKNEAFFNANLSGEALRRWKYQRYIKDYLRCIAAVDENVGRMLDYLDEAGLADDTIVIYTSDQGFYLGDHGWFDKRFMYEESLRMPLMMRYPRLKNVGAVDANIALNLDFAPTLLELAGVTPPPEMQGRSLVPLLRGRTPQDWRQAMYYHYTEYPAWHMVKKHYGIRTDRYKLMHFYDDIDAWELYDLKQDPGEMHNIFGQPDQAPLVQTLRSQLDSLQHNYRDPIVVQ